MTGEELFDYFVTELDAVREDSHAHNISDNLWFYALRVDGDADMTEEEWTRKATNLSNGSGTVTGCQVWLPSDLWNPGQTELHITVRKL